MTSEGVMRQINKNVERKKKLGWVKDETNIGGTRCCNKKKWCFLYFFLLSLFKPFQKEGRDKRKKKI